MTMKTALLSLTTCVVVLAGSAHAAAPPDAYAVVALVGDSITVVNYEGVTGSSLDRNERQRVPLSDGVLDRVATRIAVNAIHRALPDAVVQGVDLPDRARFGDADELFGAGGHLPALLSAVKPLLRSPDVRYLVVVSKFRGDAHLRTRSGTIGSGKLTGLGFYVDSVKRMTKTETGESGRGFVAPYAYVQVSLVDLQTASVVRSESATESTTRANAGPTADLDPWDALTPEQKVRILENLLGRALQKAVPLVVAPA